MELHQYNVFLLRYYTYVGDRGSVLNSTTISNQDDSGRTIDLIDQLSEEVGDDKTPSQSPNHNKKKDKKQNKTPSNPTASWPRGSAGDIDTVSDLYRSKYSK